MVLPDPRPLLRTFGDWLSEPAAVGLFQKAFNPSPRSFAWAKARSVLVVKLDDIGDFVLATPFFRELRRNAPLARVSLVVKPSLLGLAALCPHVDDILPFDGNTLGLSGWRLRRQGRALRLAFARFRSSPPDVAIILRRDVDIYHATQLAVYSGAPAIVAYAEDATPLRARLNAGYDRLATHLVSDPVAHRHEVRSNLALISRFGGEIRSDALELRPSSADQEFARTALPDAARHVVLAAGAADPARRWPADRFARLARLLREQQGLVTVALGAPGDPDPGCEINLIGRTTLPQTLALLARARLFVGNDSGLKHLAAAAAVPVMEISALREDAPPGHHNSPARFHAWGVPFRVARPPAGPGPELALHEVPYATVELAALDLLRSTASPPDRHVA